MTIELLYPNAFDLLMKDSLMHERTKLSTELETLLNIENEDKAWFPMWLKINFSNIDLKAD